jgi:hypothetical protein
MTASFAHSAPRILGKEIRLGRILRNTAIFLFQLHGIGINDPHDTVAATCSYVSNSLYVGAIPA